LVHESARWYLAAINLYTFQGASGTADLAKGAATELYLNGRAADAANVLDSYLTSVPTDIDAWEIRLAISKDLPKEAAKFNDLTQSVVSNAVARLQSIRANAGATTQPTGNDLGDIAGDRALLVKANQSQLTDAYIAAAGDLAWVRLYFLRDAGPQTQAVLDALAKLLPDDDVLLCRLEGWKYLVQGQWAQAREKLSAVADRDPYAALGMVLVYDQAGEKPDANALAKKTMAAHPAEPEAAVLYSALRSHDANVIPIGQFEGITTVVTTLSTDWFNIVTRPADFYTVNAAPLNPEVGFNQPMLARVTIQNTGNYDIALGEDAVLHPDFSFDASIRGLLEDDEPNMAVDRFWQRLVLPRGQSASQVVRLDRGRFKRFLAQHFDVPVDVQFAVTTNPIFVNGQFVAGPAGQHSQFLTLQERASTPVASDQDLQILCARLGKGSPSDRMYAADAVANFIDQLLSGQPDTRSKSIAASLMANLRLACKDPDAPVRDWATYLVVTRSSPDDREKFVPTMTASDDWAMRFLGLIAAENLSDKGAIAAQALSNDTDPDVKQYANAWSDRLASMNAATTQPAQ
ncbi:MAG TPA: hypothetical protein VMU31_03915, partial [Rhizomicrobium sp.]|nr:hypothetical protein [Rhizomicrobium sp.]